MSVVTRDDLKSLLATTEGPLVSIYLPTHRVGPEIQQDPLKLNALIERAEMQLMAGGLRTPDAIALLQPARALLDDTHFWQHQREGLALLLAPNFHRRYQLPVNVTELVVVGERFYLKPLLSLLDGEQRFFVLALSQNRVSLFEGTRHRLSEVELPEMPESLTEALHYDQFERQQQFRTRTPAMAGKRTAIFHGHSVGTDDKGENLRHYFLQIDHSLHRLLRDEQAPLVIASVEHLLSLYQKVNTYPHLLESGISGNPETLTTAELHHRAWPVVQAHVRQAQQKASRMFDELAYTGRTSTDLAEILRAAHQGRIATLFVATTPHQWGRFDAETNTLHFHQTAQPGDEDLLDTVALHTFLNGGTVYVVRPEQVPAEALVAAVFRY